MIGEGTTDIQFNFPDVVRTPKFVGAREYETAVSILVRLAIANGMRDVRHLLRSTPGLRSADVWGRDRHVEVAARLSGFSLSSVAAATPVKLTAPRLMFAGAQFKLRGVGAGRTCPSCIAEDLDIYARERLELRSFRRGWWQVPSITTCPIHRTCLVERCPKCERSLDERLPVGRCHCGPTPLPRIEVNDAACRHDAWLLGRLRVQDAAYHPLDVLPPGLASELCWAVGNALLGHKEGSLSNEDAASLARIRTAGFEALRDDEGGFEKALDRILADRKSRRGVCSTSYGGLHLFLTVNPDPVLDPLRERLLAHTAANVALGNTGKQMFRQVFVEGERLSTIQAASVLGIAPNFLNSFLRALDTDVTSGSTVPNTLDRRQFTLLKNALDSTMRSSKVAKHLGFDLATMRLALHRKILNCIVPPSKGEIAWIFRHDVNRLARLFSRPPIIEHQGVLTTKGLARAARVTVADVMLEVVEGRLRPVGRIRDVRGLPSLLFEPCAADGLFARLRGGIHRRRLMSGLGWMVSTVAELQRRGLLSAGSGAISPHEVEAFRRDFVTAHEACSLLREPPKSPKLTHKLMTERCGAPAISGTAVTAFWSRTLILPCLGDLMKPDADRHAIGVEAAI